MSEGLEVLITRLEGKAQAIRTKSTPEGLEVLIARLEVLRSEKTSAAAVGNSWSVPMHRPLRQCPLKILLERRIFTAAPAFPDLSTSKNSLYELPNLQAYFSVQ